MRLVAAFIAFFVALAAPVRAEDEPRFALLIGNQDYPDEPGALRRPHADVAALRAALAASGFDVSVALDADAEAIEAAVGDLAERLRAAGPEAVGFLYYAGHGATATSRGERRNYMLPAGAEIGSASAVAQRGVRWDRQIDALETSGAGALFAVFDACRNEFSRGSRGFEPVDTRPGLLMALSTMADATTPDDGAYALALANEIARSGQTAEQAFINASLAVNEARADDQFAVVIPALTRRFCFQACEEGEATGDAELAAFALAADIGTPEAYQDFLSRYPEGVLAEVARERAAAAEEAAVEAELPGHDRLAYADVDGVAILDGRRVTTATPPGSVFADVIGGGRGPEMAILPVGSFVMGSPLTEAGRDSDEDGGGLIAFQRPFAIGRFEVSVGEYQRFVRAVDRLSMGVCRTDRNGDGDWTDDPEGDWDDPGFDQDHRHPVVCVSWRDARDYAAWLSEQTGETYRLATEAEWEYAAEAGSQGEARYVSGDDPAELCAHANIADERARRFYGWESIACDDQHLMTARRGSFQPNDFGIYDMTGNASEWVQDCHGDYRNAPSDGSAFGGPPCNGRVFRGGSYSAGVAAARVANRQYAEPDRRTSGIGFRLVRELTEE